MANKIFTSTSNIHVQVTTFNKILLSRLPFFPNYALESINNNSESKVTVPGCFIIFVVFVKM